MKILRKYILKQMVSPFLLFLGIFTFVLLIGNLIKLADLVINKGVEGIDILKLFLTYIPYLLSYTIPMSLLSATLLTFSRLSADGEIITLRASGINISRLTIPIIIVGLIFSLGNIILNDQILPKARFAARKIVAEIGTKNPESYLEPGTFIKNFEQYIIFIYDIKKNELEGIRIYQPQDQGPTRTIIAEKGKIIKTEQPNKIKLKLINGTSDEPAPEKETRFYKLRFKTYYVTLTLDKYLNTNIGKKPKDMSIQELRWEIENLKKKSVDIMPLLTAIHKRISLSFACLAFIVIAIPLGIISKKSGKSIGLGLSLVVIIFYYILLVGIKALCLRGILLPAFLWTPNVVLIISGTYLMYEK